jgi:serine/threonine protein kinase
MTKIQYFSTQEMLKYVNTLEQLRETDVILELITRTKRALDCLRRHAIYHNDTHSDNVLFYQPEGPFGLVKPCLIDFGKASCFMTLPSSTGIIALHSTADPIDEFKLWLNMKVERLNASDKTKAYLMEYNKYGGIIVRKTQKRNKKRISRRGKHRGKYSAKHNKGKRSRRRK